jgi:hypothetical protein
VSALPDDDDVAEEATRLVSEQLAEAAGATRGPSVTLRFAKGSDLLAWFEQYGAAHDLSRNGAMITALTVFRTAVERRARAEGTTQ